MNLVSCGACGEVMDKDRIYEPYNYKETADGKGEEIDTEHAAWDGESWATTIPCPSWDCRIYSNTGGIVY